MGSLKMMAKKCRICPEKDKCDHKRMEACCYIEMPNVAMSVARPSTAELAMPILVPHDYRDIKVSENMTITIDVEELKRQLEKDFYKSLGCGLDYGA